MIAMASFIYNGDGNRVNGVTTTYIGNYFEWHTAITDSVKYYYAGAQRIAMRVGNGSGTDGLSWLFADHLGSTSITADASGNKVAELRYKAWGELRFTFGSTPTTFGYTGQRSENALGLIFYGARWYDNSLGRWVQPDTNIPEQYNSLDWDRYVYVRNNPLTLVDPNGHEPGITSYIEGWNPGYMFRQQGNTCGVAAMAVALSILNGHQYTQQDI